MLGAASDNSGAPARSYREQNIRPVTPSQLRRNWSDVGYAASSVGGVCAPPSLTASCSAASRYVKRRRMASA